MYKSGHCVLTFAHYTCIVLVVDIQPIDSSRMYMATLWDDFFPEAIVICIKKNSLVVNLMACACVSS